MKSVKEMTDDVIDMAIENIYSETEHGHDEDGGHSETTLSPKPELYTKLNQYFTEMRVEQLVDALKSYYNQKRF